MDRRQQPLHDGLGAAGCCHYASQDRQLHAGRAGHAEGTGAAGYYVRQTDTDLIIQGASGTFVAETVEGSRTIRGQLSGAEWEPATVATKSTNFLQRSTTPLDNTSYFVPVMDVLPTLLRNCFVDCGVISGLGNKQVLLWFSYTLESESNPVYYNFPAEGNTWTKLFDTTVGPIRHFHGATMVHDVNGVSGSDLLVVYSGDSVDQSALLYCDHIADLVTNPGKWVTYWGLDKTGAARTEYLTKGEGAAHSFGVGPASKTIDFVVDTNNRYAYYIPDTPSASDPRVTKVDLVNKTVSSIGTPVIGPGAHGARLSNGMIVLGTMSEAYNGRYQGNSDASMRLYLLDEQAEDIKELWAQQRRDAAAPNALSFYLSVVEFPVGAGGGDQPPAVWLGSIAHSTQLPDTGTVVGRITPWGQEQPPVPPAMPSLVNLIENGRFLRDDLSGWLVVRGTLARETTTVDTAGGNNTALEIIPNSSGATYAFYRLASDVLDTVRGNWITVTSRVLWNSPQTVQLTWQDDRQYRWAYNTARSPDWQTMQLETFVPPDATKGEVYLYARTSGDGTDPIYFSDVSLVIGALGGRVAPNLHSRSELSTQPGVLTSGTYQHEIGGGQNLVLWEDYGGFAARGGTLTVILTPSGGTPGGKLIWRADLAAGGQSSQGLNGNVLQLNHPMADNVVTLTNAMELQGQCAVTVSDKPFEGTDWAVISGVLSSAGGDLEGSFEKRGPGTLYVTADNTYLGRTIVEQGTLYLTGANAYAGGTFLNGGTLVPTTSGSLGTLSSELTFNGGTLDLPDSFGEASRAGNLALGGGTINTAAAVSFTLTATAQPLLGGSLTKDGPGLLVINSNPIGGNVTVNGGMLQVGLDLLAYAMPGGGVVSLAPGTTLRTSGIVNRRVVNSGGPHTSILEAMGTMDVGVLSDTAGYSFQGTLKVGSNMVRLKDADMAELYGAILEGGSLSSFNGIEIQPFDPLLPAPSTAVQGHGTINGNVTLSRPGKAPAVVAGTTDPILMTGTVRGNATMINVIRTGLYKPGFGPTFLVEVPAPGATDGETEFQILGSAGGQVTGIPDFMGNGLIPGDYTQLYLAGGDLPVIGTFKIFTHDPQNPTNAYSPKLGDEFRLLVTGPFDAGFLGGNKPPATLSYPDSTGQTLFNFQDAPLAPGLDWAWRLNPDGLILMVVPDDPDQWQPTGGGSYNVPSNWTNNNVPNAVDAEAEFLGVITAPATVTVDMPLNVAGLKFRNANAYTLAGPGTISLTQVKVEQGSHVIQPPLSFASLNVNTDPGTSLTLTQNGLLTGNVTKAGSGSLVVGRGTWLTGNLVVGAGVVDTAKHVLALGGGPITIGNATLKAVGSVPRPISMQPGADPPVSTIMTTGPLTLGDQASAGYNFEGILDVGAHPVTVLGPPGMPVVTTVILSGGTLTGSPELKVAPVVGFIIGTGEVSGTVRLGDKATKTNAGGLYGQDAAHKLVISGLITGRADGYGDVAFTGADRRGWSPDYTVIYGALSPTETRFLIGGLEPGIIVEGPKGQSLGVPGDYTQFLIAGYKDIDGGAPPYQESFFDHPKLEWDPDSSLGGWAALSAGELRLIVVGPAKFYQPDPLILKLVARERGMITYGPNFFSELQAEMAKYESQLLAAGLGWGPVSMNSDMLVLTIVPEPGTLALLLSGGLGLLALACSRLRRR